MSDKVLHVQFLHEVEVGWTYDRPDGCLISRSNKAIQDFMNSESWFDPKLKEFSKPDGEIIYCNVKDEAIKRLDESDKDVVWLSRVDANKLIIDRNHTYQPKKVTMCTSTGQIVEVDNPKLAKK